MKTFHFGEKKAFTLNELLIVMAIAMIAIGISLFTLKDARQRKEVEVSTIKLASIIKEIQNDSLVGKNQFNSGNSNKLEIACFYGVQSDDGSIVQTYYQFKNLLGDCDYSVEKNFSTVEFKNTSFGSSGWYVSLSVPFGKVETSTGSDLEIDVVSTINNSIKGKVCVSTQGNITDSYSDSNCN